MDRREFTSTGRMWRKRCQLSKLQVGSGKPPGERSEAAVFSTAENTANELDLEPNFGAGCSSVGGSCFQISLPSITARSPVAAKRLWMGRCLRAPRRLQHHEQRHGAPASWCLHPPRDGRWAFYWARPWQSRASLALSKRSVIIKEEEGQEWEDKRC